MYLTKIRLNWKEALPSIRKKANDTTAMYPK
jgi:hypothetical protein